MGKGKQLLKNTAIVTIGKIATQLITFFLLPIYTALLTQEEYGVVDLLNTLVSLCRGNRNEETKIITTILKFIVIQSFIYIIIILIASSFINNPYKYFLAGNLIVSIFSSIFLQIARGLGDNKSYAIGSLISGFAIVILNIILIVVFSLGAYGMLLATLLGNLICAIYIFWNKKLYKYIKLKQNDKNLLKEILKYSVPLIPNMISWWVVNASDRTIVTAILGIAQNRNIFSSK